MVVLQTKSTMDKKDILIYVAVFILAGLSLYRRYVKKKGVKAGAPQNKSESKNILRDQPDDYEPYSGKKDQA